MDTMNTTKRRKFGNYFIYHHLNTDYDNFMKLPIGLDLTEENRVRVSLKEAGWNGEGCLEINRYPIIVYETNIPYENINVTLWHVRQDTISWLVSKVPVYALVLEKGKQRTKKEDLIKKNFIIRAVMLKEKNKIKIEKDCQL